MTSSSPGITPDTPRYPERAATESLTAFLCRTAEELGIGLPVPQRERYDFTAGFDSADDRRIIVSSYRDIPGYLVCCRGLGAWLAAGRTADPAAAVRAAAAWTSGAGLQETRRAAPFIEFRAWALAHEREPLDPVELAWRHKIDRHFLPPWDRFPRSLALTEAAHAQPALRRLTPVTSHFMLWFATTVEHPYERVGYSVDPHHDGQYAVRDRGEVVALTDTPEEAVAIVVAHLPRHLGPAD